VQGQCRILALQGDEKDFSVQFGSIRSFPGVESSISFCTDSLSVSSLPSPDQMLHTKRKFKILPPISTFVTLSCSKDKLQVPRTINISLSSSPLKQTPKMKNNLGSASVSEIHDSSSNLREIENRWEKLHCSAEDETVD